jgi:hypothetical protein
VNISTAGPTIVTSKAKDALAFYATHFGLTANDYGADRRPIVTVAPWPRQRREPGLLHEFAEQVAHDVLRRRVFLIEIFNGGARRGGEVTVTEPVANLLDVHALVDEPRSVGMADLVRRVVEREVRFLDCLFPDPPPRCCHLRTR